MSAVCRCEIHSVERCCCVRCRRCLGRAVPCSAVPSAARLVGESEVGARCGGQVLGQACEHVLVQVREQVDAGVGCAVAADANDEEQVDCDDEQVHCHGEQVRCVDEKVRCADEQVRFADEQVRCVDE